jgi:hypothetical protein
VSVEPAIAMPARRRSALGDRLPAVLGSLAARVLGGVLLLAAYAKALDPALFASELGDLVSMPSAVATALAIATVGFEAGLGAALLGGWRHPVVLLVANATFLAFAGVATWQLLGGGEPGGSCGCFGQLLERTPRQALAEDAGFVLLSGLAWLGRTARSAAPRWTPVALAPIAAVALAACAPWLPLDDQATALAPGVGLDATRLDDVVPELRTGRHLVVLLDRSDPASPDAVARLNDRLKLPGGPTPVWGVAEDDLERAAAFLWTAGPAFEVRSAPRRMLRRLHRTLPRSALVDGGRVVATWTGLPGEQALDALARGEMP